MKENLSLNNYVKRASIMLKLYAPRKQVVNAIIFYDSLTAHSGEGVKKGEN